MLINKLIIKYKNFKTVNKISCIFKLQEFYDQYKWLKKLLMKFLN